MGVATPADFHCMVTEPTRKGAPPMAITAVDEVGPEEADVQIYLQCSGRICDCQRSPRSPRVTRENLADIAKTSKWRSKYWSDGRPLQVERRKTTFVPRRTPSRGGKLELCTERKLPPGQVTILGSRSASSCLERSRVNDFEFHEWCVRLRKHNQLSDWHSCDPVVLSRHEDYALTTKKSPNIRGAFQLPGKLRQSMLLILMKAEPCREDRVWRHREAFAKLLI